MVEIKDTLTQVLLIIYVRKFKFFQITQSEKALEAQECNWNPKTCAYDD